MFLPTCLPSYKSPCLSLNCCACLCVLWDETYYPLHSLTLGYYHMLPYLPSYLFPTCLLIISPLPCFFPGLQHVARRARFLSLLVHLFFPSAFFTLITVVISGCFWDPRFSLPPMCSNLCPYSANFSPFSYSILLSYSFYSLRCCFCLGFRTFRCFGAINITESIIYVPSVTLLQCSSFHSLLSLPVTVILPGCFWAQDTLRGARWQRILLASHLFPYLSPCLFPTCFFIFLSPLRFFSPGAFGQRNLLVSRSSLSIAQCSSFWWLWGQDSSLICFRTRLSTSLSHVAVLSGCFRGTICSLSSVCLRAYPPCSLQLVPLLLSLSLFFSLGAYLDTWFSSSPICLRTCLPCSLQVISLIASPLLFFSFLLLGCFLYLSLNCRACLCVLWDETYYPLHSLTLGHYHMLPYLTSYLSPACLLIISPLPCFFPGHQHFGTERRVFLLFPFFPYLFP